MTDAHDGDDVDAQAVDDADPDEIAADGAAWVERLRSGSRMRDVIAEDDDNNADDDASDADDDPGC